MEFDHEAARLTQALGEAAFAGLSQAALWMILVQKEVIGPQQAIEALDAVLVRLERDRGNDPGAMDYARSRLEATIAQIGRLGGTRTPRADP